MNCFNHMMISELTIFCLELRTFQRVNCRPLYVLIQELNSRLDPYDEFSNNNTLPRRQQRTKLIDYSVTLLITSKNKRIGE